MKAAVRDLFQSEAAVVRDLDALVERMRGGQERALEVLYDATVGKLYALASAILRNVEDTEEIVCETYAYAWANAARFDASRAGALGWLLMLCRSRALDRLRQRRTTAGTLDVDALAETCTSRCRFVARAPHDAHRCARSVSRRVSASRSDCVNVQRSTRCSPRRSSTPNDGCSAPVVTKCTLSTSDKVLA